MMEWLWLALLVVSTAFTGWACLGIGFDRGRMEAWRIDDEYRESLMRDADHVAREAASVARLIQGGREEGSTATLTAYFILQRLGLARIGAAPSDVSGRGGSRASTDGNSTPGLSK
jgi:hypothetical protein